MTKSYQVGDMVVVRFYNEQDGRFYGKYWDAKIIQLASVGYTPERNLVVEDMQLHRLHTIWKKEIKGRIKKDSV